MKKETLLATALAATLGGIAAEPMKWTDDELFAIPRTLPDTGLEKYRVPGVKSFLLEGPLTSDMKETFAYAYYALPDGEAPEGGFPAVVLFHGGGGTAFASYVKLWRDRGYAVITFDHYGQLPDIDIPRPQRPVLKNSWQDRAGGFGEGNYEQRHLWVHNGVALAVRANTFLRRQKEINPDKIGLLGISWGSVMGSIALSLDHRFAYAALCYGCGNWDRGTDGSFIKYAADCFEPKYYVKDIISPTLWVAGTNDDAFEIAQWQETWQNTPATQAASLVVRLDHDHVGWDYMIVRRYADFFAGKETKLPVVSKLTVENGTAKATVVSCTAPVTRAELVYSTGLPGVKRVWKSLPAVIDGNNISAHIPADAKAVYLGVFDREYAGKWQFPVVTDVVEIGDK